MTWADYRPIPGTNWADNAQTRRRARCVSRSSPSTSTDQPFVDHAAEALRPVRQSAGRSGSARRGREVLRRRSGARPARSTTATRSTSTGWSSRAGRIGIPKIDAVRAVPDAAQALRVRPERVQPGRAAAPPAITCDGRMEPDADALWAADAGADIRKQVRHRAAHLRRLRRDDGVAGVRRDEVRDRATTSRQTGAIRTRRKPRWVTTRYVPWTSWLAGAQQWGLSSVRQGESSGTITHEIGHCGASASATTTTIPYVTPYRRVGTGPWDMMDRGSFNGPGGPHRRWVVPGTRRRGDARRA